MVSSTLVKAVGPKTMRTNVLMATRLTGTATRGVLKGETGGLSVVPRV